MSDHIFGETPLDAQNDSSNRILLEQSQIFISPYPFLRDEDVNIDRIQIDCISNSPKKKGRGKRRQIKYDRLGHEANQDKRDVKKYARFDTTNEIIQKYSKLEDGCYHIHQKLAKQKGVSKRSLKYYFLVLGVLKKEGQLHKFYDFFKANSDDILRKKYHFRSEIFRSILMTSIYFSKRAIELFLDGDELYGIEVAYTQNECGTRGRTKNPTQMEKCRKFYENIFTISHIRSKKSDLDMLFN